MTSAAQDINRDARKIVLFVDFDGVTHPEPCLRIDEFCFLPLIEQVLREHIDLDVVISSSWRHEHSLDQLRGFFSPDVAQRVVGVTPSNKNPSQDWLPASSSGHQRG